MIHYLYSVIVLIELDGAIACIISMADGVHQKFANGPIRVICDLLFLQCGNWYRASVRNGCLYKSIRYTRYIFIYIYSFVYSFVYSFIYSFICSFICSFIYPFICSFTCPFVYSFIRNLMYLSLNG